MRSLLTCLLLVSISTILVSCDSNKQEETVCTPANTAYFPQDAKDRFFFKEGTWWIYENVDNNEIDSVWVSNSNTNYWSANNQEDGFIKDKCYEAIRVDLFSSKEGKIEHLIQRSFSHNGGKTGINPNQEHFTLYDRNPAFDFRPIYRFDIINNNYVTPNQLGAEITFIDSLNITGSIYQNIMYYKYPNSLPQYEYINKIYIASKIGILKYTLVKDDSNWELVRYKIVQ